MRQYGRCCAFFYANKIVTTGEGGMVADDPRIVERAASYRNLCFKPENAYIQNLAILSDDQSSGCDRSWQLEASEFINKRSLGEFT
jgi:dTDP-4-amino-4,6-dideoxygalactose transaminase